MKPAVFNLWHTRKGNGMFYYGLDYALTSSFPWTVFVQPSFPVDLLPQALRSRVEVLGTVQYVLKMLAHRWRGGFVFTPTPHPFPFFSRQLIVLHDAYPFHQKLGLLKTMLLLASLMSSRCSVGYINRSDALRFLKGLGIADNRLFYMPNRVIPEVRAHAVRPCRTPMQIGLIGSDSEKKNYAALFKAACSNAVAGQFEFNVYGHPTPYLEELRRRFPTIRMTLVESDQTSLSGFLERVDVIVSVSHGEGFCRPIASALTADVPCFLLRDEVFLEFYEHHALFSNNAQELVHALLQWRDGGGQGKPTSASKRFPPSALSRAFEQGSQCLAVMIKGTSP